MDTGDRIEVEIERVVYRGSGLARVDGRVVFVPGVLPGERATVEISRVKKGFAEARLVELIESSASRQEPDCRLPGGETVPGCVYDHVEYGAEVALKQTQLEEQLRRFGGVEELDYREPFASPASLHYRNKVTLHSVMDGRVLGYVGDDNRTVIDLPECPLAMPPLNELLATLREDEEFRSRLRRREHVTLRYTETDGPLFWVGKADARAPELVQSSAIGPLWVPRRSFFQVNDAVADELVRYVSGMIESGPPKYLVDLYCGVGVFGIAGGMSGAQHVLGIENDYRALSAARKNAELLQVQAEFIDGKCGEVCDGALDAVVADETMVIIDPPRTGIEPGVMQSLLNRRPKGITYVSCAPDTLGRDVKRLREGGYELEDAALFDMFPRTAHFETVARLTAR